jgi:hypothetical protein
MSTHGGATPASASDVWHDPPSPDPERDEMRLRRQHRAEALEERRRQERQQVAHERAVAARAALADCRSHQTPLHRGEAEVQTT